MVSVPLTVTAAVPGSVPKDTSSVSALGHVVCEPVGTSENASANCMVPSPGTVNIDGAVGTPAWPLNSVDDCTTSVVITAPPLTASTLGHASTVQGEALSLVRVTVRKMVPAAP